MYSKIQKLLGPPAESSRWNSGPEPFSTTISPGAISLSRSAPTMSSAQLSDATAHPPLLTLPKHRGRYPRESLTATSRPSIIITSE